MIDDKSRPNGRKGATAEASVTRPSKPFNWKTSAPMNGQSAHDWGWDLTVIPDHAGERQVSIQHPSFLKPGRSIQECARLASRRRSGSGKNIEKPNVPLHNTIPFTDVGHPQFNDLDL